MREWITMNFEAFERDVLHDFCLASVSLGEQFERLATNGNVSFAVLQYLVGEPLNKGLFWRLKDKAHHIFKRGADNPAGPMLDWSMGYIFHESLKLMEDAHQRQYYGPYLDTHMQRQKDPALAAIMKDLSGIRQETCESICREVARLQKLLSLSRKLFHIYFAGRADHKPLARFLNDNPILVKEAFQEDYGSFFDAVYGNEPERMFVEAARSLFESARFEAADRALDTALSLNPSSPTVQALLAEKNASQQVDMKII
jgi:hypothetical protein